MAKKTDPIYGYEVDTLEADHIMPLKEITEQSGFDQLSFEDQKAICKFRRKLYGTWKTNASKGAKSISAWSGHSKLGAISEEAQQFLNQKDEAARAAIAKAISERLERNEYLYQRD